MSVTLVTVAANTAPDIHHNYVIITNVFNTICTISKMGGWYRLHKRWSRFASDSDLYRLQVQLSWNHCFNSLMTLGKLLTIDDPGVNGYLAKVSFYLVEPIIIVVAAVGVYAAQRVEIV